LADQPAAPASAAELWIKRNFNLLVLAIAAALIVIPYVTPWDINVFRAASEWILNKIETLFEDYGYYVVFFGVLLENSMFLGLLVPGAIILILAGLSAENGSINLFAVVALAFCATVIGDTISYFIGRIGGRRVVEGFGGRELLERVQGPLEANSTWIIIGYHLAGYSRAVGPAAAGIFRIPFRRWAPLDYLGGMIWVLIFTSAGYVLGLAGVEFGDTKRMVQLIEIGILVIFAGAIALAVYRASKKGPGRPAETARPATVVVPVDDADQP